MLQRFFLMWPAMCLASMGVHVFASGEVPSLFAIIATAMLIMPLAAISARFLSPLVLALMTMMTQLFSHVTLSLQSLGTSALNGHHGHAAHDLAAPLMGSSEAVHAHGGLSPLMITMHCVASVLLTVVLHHVDAFIATIVDFFTQLFVILVPRIQVVSQLPVLPSLERVANSLEFFHQILRRGPPLLSSL